jgi:D-alanyl-lipoteichoic acid acyltransferase DltB (MBOAT superfamily)
VNALIGRAFLPLVVTGYLGTAWVILRVSDPAWRARLFAALNVAGVFLLWYALVPGGAGMLAAYLALVVGHHLLTRRCAMAPGALPWIAILAPVALLVVAKAAPVTAVSLVGLSYLTFRLAYLVVEVRNGVAPMPSLAQHVGFAFFVPTLAVGPISPSAAFSRSLTAPDATRGARRQALLRIVVGAAKFMFLAHLIHKISYDALLLDGHPHGPVDYVVAGVAYYLYVYCNFSGFCDVMIGASGLLGLQVAENFDHPLAARNVREFWNRWHITLSSWMRDVVFAPVSKALLHRVGPTGRDHAIGATVFLVFLLIGLWHGFGGYYLLFGALHAAGVTANHYWAIAVKRRRARTGGRGVAGPWWVRWLCVAATQAYVCLTFYFFWKAGQG